MPKRFLECRTEVAYRVGERIEYAAAAADRVTNSEDANRLLARAYREGWSLRG